jgi:hypothetical protein
MGSLLPFATWTSKVSSGPITLRKEATDRSFADSGSCAQSPASLCRDAANHSACRPPCPAMLPKHRRMLANGTSDPANFDLIHSFVQIAVLIRIEAGGTIHV